MAHMQAGITQKRKNFAELVPFFDSVSQTNLHKDLMSSLCAILPLKPKTMGLELGAGTGVLSHLICSKHKIIMHCTDGLMEMLKAGESSYPHHQIIRSRLDIDTMMPPVQDNFDFIVGSLVFHLIADPDKLFKNLYGLLKPGGSVSFLTPSLTLNRDTAERWCSHEGFSGIEKEFIYGMTNSGIQGHRFQETQLAEMVRRSGFSEPRFSYTGHENSLMIFSADRPLTYRS